MRKTPLDEKFWKRFAGKYWERKPLVLQNIESDLLALDADEVFKLVAEAADRSRREKKLLGFKFFTHGIRSSDVETLFVLPRKSDKSFVGYNERMERMYQDYCLVCDELLQVSRKNREHLIQFTNDLYREVGFPNQFTEMGLYIGNYRKTPFGVHRDECGVFSFPIVGVKKFRAWTSAYASKNPTLQQSFRYSKHKDQSELLEVNPGDMAYWPSSSWHIAESNGSFSATWSLGVWVNKPTQDSVAETLKLLLAKKVGPKFLGTTTKLATKGSSQDELPPVFKETIAAIRNLSKGELEEAFRDAWKKHISNSGLKP